MTDVHTKEVRSYNMSRIKGKDTKPEMIVRKSLFSKGFRYKLHNKKLPGKPDLIFPKYLTAVFVNGCFWHKHIGCRYFVIPKTRSEWWINKIDGNVSRDVRNISKLRESGWRVIVIWECELKSEKKENTLRKLAKDLTRK